MQSCTQPRTETKTAGGTISRGQAVKFSSDDDTVVKSSASTDNHIGIAQNDALVGQPVEIAIPGGGGMAQAGGTIARGDKLGVDANGDLVKVAAQHDVIIAQAKESAVDNDIFAVEVVFAQATQAQS